MRDAASDVVLGSLATCELLDEERSFLREEAPAGVTLFGRNIVQEDHRALGTLTAALQALLPSHAPAMIIAIDQEGGRVARLKPPFPNEGPCLHLAAGACDPTALAAIQLYAERVGNALFELGVNLDFAPVVDVLTEESNHAIGDRAFAREPEAASLRAEAFLDGLAKTGLLTCLKHFPGQGAAFVDTHQGSAKINKSLAELDDCELYPYLRLASKTPMIMMSHCLYPQLDPLREASLSPLIIEGLLRQRMGYRGLIVTDDMTMGAIVGKNDGSWADQIVQAIESGNDLVLVCQGLQAWQDSLTSLRQSAKESPAFRRRLAEAAERVNSLRRRLAKA